MSTWFEAAGNTLIASRWQLFLARVFGKKVSCIDFDTGCIAQGYRWRGVLYMTKFHDPRKP